MHSLRLVTLNTLGVPFVQNTRTRLRSLPRALNVANLDAVCFQEVQLSRYVPLLRREFHLLPHAAFEPYVYAPKGGLLSLSRHPIRRAEFQPFRDRRLGFGPAVADWALYKGILAVEVAARVTPVIIVNTHLSANYDGDWSRTNRYARVEAGQLAQLADYVVGCNPHALVVVAGDFNIPRKSWLYEEFMERAGVIDPQMGHEKPTYRAHRLLPSRYVQAIDFVFIRPPQNTEVNATATICLEERIEMVNGRHGYASDHFAIRVDLTWAGEASNVGSRVQRAEVVS